MIGDLVLLPGNSNPKLFKAIEQYIRGLPGWSRVNSVDCTIGTFSDTEPRIEIKENIRGKDVHILQSTCSPVGHNFIELCLMTDACRRASAQNITVVIPYFGLARQDRKKKSREPISASWACKILKASGADRIISMDLHAGQIQGFFDGPYDNLYARPVFMEYIKSNFDVSKLVVVSPDAGGADRARGLAMRLGDLLIAIIDKRRSKPNVAEVHHVLGKVKGKIAIIFDDIADTAGTLKSAAQALKKKGAIEVYGACTHPVLSGKAIKNINNSCLKGLIVTDTIPLNGKAKECKKIIVLPVAEIVAKAIMCSHNGESVSALFK
ncbi:MAG: ribose-phosphate pyrophosphokinase [Candidatus Falkowbacteria bacterium]